MPAYLENSALATGLEKVSFQMNPKQRQCQRMFKLPHRCLKEYWWNIVNKFQGEIQMKKEILKIKDIIST